jgi:FMN phosphatase YigB (HAD superfamily)
MANAQVMHPLTDSALPDELFDSIIFDLGGVLLPLFPERTVQAFGELFGQDASTAYTQTAQSELFDQFERGELTPSEFRAGVGEYFGKSVPDAVLDEAWNAMLGSLPALHLEFLEQIGKRKRTFLLSNTNEVHLERFLLDVKRDHPSLSRSFSEYFEAAHYSHELGMRKPEARAFLELTRRHSLDPSRTVFIDDNPKNVSAARSLGLLGVDHPTNSPLTPRFLPTLTRPA